MDITTYNDKKNEANKKGKINKSLIKNLKENKLVLSRTLKNEKYNEQNEDIDIKEEKKVIKNEELNKIIQNLINYQVQLNSPQTHKLILKELNSLQNEINKEENIDFYYHELYKVLSTFTYNKNSDIVSKSADILSDLSHKIINNIFLFSENEKEAIINDKTIDKNQYKTDGFILGDDEQESHLSISKEICDIILSKDNNSEEVSIKSKKSKSKKGSNDYNTKMDSLNKKDINIKEDFYISLKNNKNLSDRLIGMISNDSTKQFEQISENFFKKVYNKNNNGLEEDIAKKRKFVCIRLFSLLKKVFPNSDKEYLKKIIIFFEYNARADDPDMGKKYIKEIDNFLQKIKYFDNRAK